MFGYWLDNYTFICPCNDNGNIVWCKITTTRPKDKDGNISFDHVARKYFDMEIIDPNHFEWNGHVLSISTEEYDK